MVEKSLRTILINNPSVYGIVAARVYTEMAPEGAALPYVTLTRISTNHLASFGGCSGLADARIQIDSYANDETTCWSLWDAVRRALVNFVGTVSGIYIGAIYIQNSIGTGVDIFDGSQIMIRRKMMDFSVWYEEEVPVLSTG